MVKRLLIVAFLVVALDRISKFLAIKYLPYAVNSGTLFGMLKNTNLIFIGVTLAISAALIYYYSQSEKHSRWIETSYGLIFGAAAGNLIDRIFYGGVIDFISVWIWPSFNIADSCLVAGIGLFLLDIKLNKKK
jgi:signal peptidase II